MARNAVERAQELMVVKRKDLPLLAFEFSQHLCSEVGMCMEVLLTAFAAYAQCVEGFECSDEAYYASPGAQDWFRERGYDNAKPFVSELDLVTAENKALKESLKTARKYMRDHFNMTMTGFARALGVTPTQLSSWTSEPITTHPQFVD
jgi:hypothetical protein